MNEEDIVRIAHRCIDESPRINRIEADVSTLKSDVSTLKSDVSTLKSDVSTLKSDVSTLKSDVSELKDEQRRQGILFEDMQSKLDKVMDVVLDGNRVLKALEPLYAFKQQATDRLDAVEDSLRRHVKNRRVHRGVEP